MGGGRSGYCRGRCGGIGWRVCSCHVLTVRTVDFCDECHCRILYVSNLM